MNKSLVVKFEWEGEAAKAIVQSAIDEAMIRSLDHIIEEANKIVPHREGTLMRSGDFDFRRGGKEGTIYYDTPYARRLHENPQYRFNKGRKGKWLEKTMEEEYDNVMSFISSKISQALK